MKKPVVALSLATMALCCVCFTGCSGASSDAESAKTVENADFEKSGFDYNNYKLEDNASLYENDDETNVVTMYLTVSEGNRNENTNHTWEEVNSHSVFDYENMGVERYKVNGLLQVGDENGPVEGEFGYNQYSPNATVTIRGQYSSLSKQKNYRITINENQGKYEDQKVINLNKHVSDGLRFRNKMAYDLLKDLPGLTSLKTQFVHLYVKDLTDSGSSDAKFEDYGLYTQVEQLNKSFLKRHGLDKFGQLYKINYFEFYKNPEICLVSDENYDEAAFEARIESKGNNDHSKLLALIDDVNNTKVTGREILDKWLDEDNVASFLAFEILMGNIDTQSRNMAMYSPQNINKFYFLAWDCDGSLERSEAIIKEGFYYRDGECWEWGVSNYWNNQIFAKLLKDKDFRKTLQKKIESYRMVISSKNITKMALKYSSAIKPYIYASTSRDLLYEPLSSANYDKMVLKLGDDVDYYYKKYLESLEKPMPFYIWDPEKDGDKTTFAWDCSYDFDNEEITYSVEIADNLDFANPILVKDGLHIPAVDFRGKLMKGQYFIRVIAKNESGYTQSAFDSYQTEDDHYYYGVRTFFVQQDGSILVEGE